MIHGFGLVENNMNITIDPGETRTFQVKLTKPGVFPFYCTNFCSALHQEMQGYLVVATPTRRCRPRPQVMAARFRPPRRLHAVDGEPAVPAVANPSVAEHHTTSPADAPPASPTP